MKTAPKLLPFDSVRPLEWWKAKSGELFFFCQGILSTSWEDKFNDWGVVHAHLCDFLDPEKNKDTRKFVSMFRGSYKTTVLLGFAVFMFCWAVDRKRSVSIVYNTSTKDNAEAFMMDFRQCLTDNAMLRNLFPWIPTGEDGWRKWTKWRVEFGNVKFHVSSLDTHQVSRHYTIIINDDLVNDINAFSDKERESVIRQWRMQKSILTRYSKRGIGMELDVGTPYHSNDLISRIMTKIKTYAKFIVPYQIPNPSYDPHRPFDRQTNNPMQLSFPEMYDWVDFDSIRNDQGASIFATQYELKVLDDSDRLAYEEWIRYWSQLPTVYNRYLLVDPAGTENRKNDPSGYVVVDVDELGNLYVVYAEQFWLAPYAMLQQAERIRDAYKCDEVWFEREKYSISLADTVEHLLPRFNFGLLTHGNVPAPRRIHKLKQYFETKRLFIGKGMKDLEDQILNYPDIKHDHLLVALAYVLDVMDVPNKKYERDVDAPSTKDTELWEEIDRIKKTYARSTEAYDDNF